MSVISIVSHIKKRQIWQPYKNRDCFKKITAAAAAAAKLLQLCLTLCDPTDGYCTIIHSWNPFFDTDLFSNSIYVKIYSDYSSLLSFFPPKNVPGKTI